MEPSHPMHASSATVYKMWRSECLANDPVQNIHPMAAYVVMSSCLVKLNILAKSKILK